MGIEVLPPSVLNSNVKFTVENGKIRFGMMAVKNVGEGVIREIIRAREEKGRATDIYRFIENLDIHEINKKAIESLIKAGAFDCISENRAQLLAVYENIIESAQNSARKNIAGQMSLFQMNSEEMEVENLTGRMPEVSNFPKEILAAMEKEMLGVYLTWHPLNEHIERIEKLVTHTSDSLDTDEADSGNITDGMKVTMAGIISGKKMLTTKNNKRMAFLDVEDMYGSFEVIVFPNVYEKCAACLKEDNIVAVKGRLNFKEDEAPKVLADTVIDIRAAAEAGSTVKIRIPQSAEQGLVRVNEQIMKHRGDTPVIIYANGKTFRSKPDMWVNVSEEFKNAVIQIVGAENFKEV